MKIRIINNGMQGLRHRCSFVGCLAVLCIMLLASCGDDSETRIEAQATAFASAYFNWHFEKARSFCTVDSEKWLCYMSSQVTQDDVDSLRTMPEGVSCEIDKVLYADGDTTATVWLEVKHFLEMGGIGKVSHKVDKARYAICLVSRDGQWRVHLSAPLRAETDGQDGSPYRD